MRKRCAILTAFDPAEFRGGIETYTHQLVHLLKREGIHVDVFHTGQVPGDNGELGPDRRPRTIASSYIERALSGLRWHLSGDEEIRTIMRLKRRGMLKSLFPLGQGFFCVDAQYDFVISNAFFGYSYFPPRIPAYTILHSTHAQYAECNREALTASEYHEIKTNLGLGAERLSTVSKKVIAVSQSVAQEAELLYRAKSVCTVLTGVDRSVFHPKNRLTSRAKLGIPQEAFVTVFVARWGPEKAIDVLQSVINRTPEIFWLLVLGSGMPCPLVENERLKIAMMLDSGGVAEALSAGDVLFHPARYEGFGLVLAEAMASGIPVVAPEVGIMKNVADITAFQPLMLPSYANGKHVVVEAAVQALGRARRDESLVQAASRAGLQYAERHLDQQHWASKILAALDILAGTGR